MDDTWLAIVRVARDAGDISSLFPSGVTRLCDLPFPMFNALRMALYFLKLEELPDDERPPQKIWLNPTKMDRWWSDVKAARESKYSDSPTTMDTSQMDENEYIAEMFPDGMPQ